MKELSCPGEVENVKVVVRVRPLSDQEVLANYTNVAASDTINGTITVNNPSATTLEPPKVFTFDHVFGQDSKQVEVYNQAARAIVDNVLEGYNGTIFAYGQTGTGKTYTMEGDRSVPELRGIIPNSFAHIFGHIAKAEEEKKFLVRVSYLEIYNEEVRDLLAKDQQARLEVKERPDIGVYVKDLSSCVVYNADDMDRIMMVGNKNRSVGATNMNAHSSRSHAIFSITIEASEKGVDGKQHVRMGKLHLVDLAGSERQSKSGASGQRLKEATKINLSLSTLGNVISALVDGKSTHVPYRNSKLTRLLQDSLGGNAKTLMVANIGPAEYNYDETVSTLRYANRAKNIKNRAKINEDPKDALLRQFQKEIQELKKQLEEADASDESGSEELSSEDDGVEGEKMEHRRRPRGRSKADEQMEEIKAKIEADQKLLEEKKDMAVEEKNRIAKQLVTHEEDLQKLQSEQTVLRQKLANLEKKILIGGENLLEKAELQEKLLEESARELDERRKKEAELQHALQQKEAERIDVEERYTSLQEESVGKSKKLKKVFTLLMASKAELADQRAEQQREKESLLENVRMLTKELKLQMLIIDNFLPPEYQDMIEEHAHWNEDIGEWQLRCVAYTGNNMRKQTPVRETGQTKQPFQVDLSNTYLTYGADGHTDPARQKNSYRMKSSRSRSSAKSSKQ